MSLNIIVTGLDGTPESRIVADGATLAQVVPSGCAGFIGGREQPLGTTLREGDNVVVMPKMAKQG